MTILEIPRVKAGSTVAEKPLGDSLRDVLAAEAMSKLGYTALRDDAVGSKRLGALTGQLTETLLKLEIEPLDAVCVIRYQMEEAGRKTMEKIQDNFRDWTQGWFTQASWTHTELQKYKEAIPEFVIRKAIQIKDALPEVRFVIQHMNEPKADPFLVTILNEEIYYVEAWDEPRFEGTI